MFPLKHRQEKVLGYGMRLGGQSDRLAGVMECCGEAWWDVTRRIFVAPRGCLGRFGGVVLRVRGLKSRPGLIFAGRRSEKGSPWSDLREARGARKEPT